MIVQQTIRYPSPVLRRRGFSRKAMMDTDKDALKIPKKLIPVKIWVHPDGLVMGEVGEIFVHLQSYHQQGEEEPVEVMNNTDAFLAMRSRTSGELRFYNKHAVVRLEHEVSPNWEEPEFITRLGARLYLMDGSLLQGTIREILPPESSRLYDYINIFENRFIRLFLSDQVVTLVNKAYIVRAAEWRQLPPT
ncbi:hypothetical protein SAMN05421693_11021 [Ectothiorhodospira magna]|uniref:Uncharacterized protein n=1 Tax=Ectothiorhodospira magna TaxID=867345 RepID=A0A1H9BQI0_9GAMM|nr:hypothetical protein [Ectothiorhodospira magna]SEP90638.1 hypothetical protein SAMN05421693_11021 [Ectothiorhodospira magna]